jgi:hypothetical protein
MPISVRNRGLFAAIEDVYGVAETLAAGDALQVMDLQPVPTEQLRMLERTIIRGSLQPGQSRYGGSLFGFSFGVELKGSGAAGTAPRLGRLLRACGIKETIVVSTSVTYQPESDLAEHDSVTIGYREGPNRRVIAGCRGNVAFDLNGGQYGRLNFTMLGHISEEVEGALATPTFETTLPEPFLNATFVIGSYAASIASMTLDLTNTVAVSPNPNSADGFGEVRVTARNTQGSVNPEAEDISDKNFIAELRAGTQQVIQTGVIGSSAGNRWAVSVPKSYWLNLAYGDRESLLTFDGSFGCVETSGDDEWSLQLT